MKHLKILALSFLITMLSSFTVTAASFDFIAPSSINVNQEALGLGIGTPTWGLLVATDYTIMLQDLQDATVSVTIDNPSVIWGGSNQLINESFYAPLSPGEVAGYVESGPVTDNSNLLSFLNIGETLKNTNAGLTGMCVQFPEDFLGSVDLNYALAIGGEHVEFTTQLNFVSSLSSGLWWEITDGVRLTSTTGDPAPVPEPSTILLVATGLIGLAGFRKKLKK